MAKVLIIRLGAIGDVVHSTIIADTIKAHQPNDTVHFLTADFLVDLLKNHRSISKVIGFDLLRKNDFVYLTILGQKLRREGYDKIFALSGAARIFYLSFLANPFGIVTREKTTAGVVGFYKTALKVYNNAKIPDELKLSISEVALSKIDSLITHPYFVFCPCGANNNEREGRIWNKNYWIELGNFLAEKYNAKIYIVGATSELEAHRDYEKIKNVTVLSGKLSLTESAALFSKAEFVVSGDSGPLHIAAATGVKTIAIMGSTSPKINGAFGPNGFSAEPRIECKYCGQKKCKLEKIDGIYSPCINSILPQDIIQIIEKNITQDINHIT